HWRVQRAVGWRPALAGLATATVALAAGAALYLAPSTVPPAADVVQAMTIAKDAPKARPVPIVRLKAGVAAAADTVSGDVTAVGDSVLLGSGDVLTATIPGTRIYAHMGWQASQIVEQIQQLHDASALTPIVIVHLGTNGFVQESQLRRMLELLKDCKRVVLVNTHVPRRWMDLNNELFARVVADYHNAVLADWRALSNNQADFFISDGIHLTGPGKRVFISEIIRAGHIALPPGPRTARAVDPNARYAYAPGDLSATLVRYPKPMPLDAFWFALAKCQSGGIWNGGDTGGGLGIKPALWMAWGGGEFAATAAAATPEQQIVVANRISTQGWRRGDGSIQEPAGFGGWRCAVAEPDLVSFTPDSVLAQAFHWLERGQVVRDLQLMLGLPRDGIYSRHTGQRHMALLAERGLPATLAGSAR
ncbi:MAG TPA: transglycosylase family protein, partial [Rhizomicrobium sp.]